MCTTYRETTRTCILNALWFIMCGHCATNILLSKICLLFFAMFDSAGLYAVGRLSITSGNTTPYFQACSTFPIYISWLWCTPVMYTMICLVAVCSCYHGLAINSLHNILCVRTPTRCHIDLAGNTSYHFAASRTVFPRVSPYHGPGPFAPFGSRI